MALGRWVVTQTVTVTPDTIATLVAGEPGTGGAAGFGNFGTLAAPTAAKFGWLAATYQEGVVVYADSAAGVTTGAQLLYQAIGAGNLRAFVDGQDNVGHAALGN